jgi:tetratricopeptide (TPR) repeat protein
MIASGRPTLLATALVLLLAAAPLFAQAGDPGSARKADLLIESAQKLIEEGKFEAALDPLSKASTLNTEEGLAPFLMAHCEFQLYRQRGDRGRLVAAMDRVKESLERDPRPGEAWFLGGAIAAELEDYAVAVRCFDGALERGFRPRDCRVNLAQCLHFWGARLAADPSADAEAATRIVMGATDQLAALKDDLRLDEKLRAHLARLWRHALTNLVALHQRTEHLKEAEAVLRRLCRIEPLNYLHHYNLGLLLGGADRLDEALVEYRKALELCEDEEWIEPYPMMGWILSVKGENEAAEKLFAEYLARFPESWEAWYRLGGHQARRGRFDEAVASYTKCLELDPRAISTMEEMAETLSKAGREADAAKWKALYEALREIYKIE